MMYGKNGKNRRNGRYNGFAGGVRKRPSGGSCAGGAVSVVKPTAIGLAVALLVAMAFVMVFALVFVIMKSIVASAVVPLSLLALMIGCFVGGFLSASLSRERGLLYGLIIGAIVFLGSWIIGIAMGGETFGLLTAVKLVLLLLAGGCGGWIGSNRAHTRRR